MRRLKSQTASDRFSRAIHDAKRSGKEWTISREAFYVLCEAACDYCGDYFKSGGKGLDRIDNDKDYHEDNVVPCCKSCNRMRNNLLTPEETTALIALLKQMRGGKVWG